MPFQASVILVPFEEAAVQVIDLLVPVIIYYRGELRTLHTSHVLDQLALE